LLTKKAEGLGNPFDVSGDEVTHGEKIGKMPYNNSQLTIYYTEGVR
jgi:hypothetical protein